MPLNYSTLISGTNNNDSIQNFTQLASISSNNGDDTIDNYGDTVMINAGTEKDIVFSTGNDVTIHAGTGDDTVNATGDRNYIYGENDADSIYNSGADSSVNGGFGNDYIQNDGYHVAIDGSNDNDTIENTGDRSTILGGIGDDLINNWGADLTINAGAGDDTVFNHASDIFVDGGAGNDVLYNESSRVIINANVGNDTVRTDGDYSSISAGLGNDSVIICGNYATVSVGAGDDSVDVLYENAVVMNDGGTVRVAVADEISTSVVGSRNNDAIIITSSDTNLAGVVTVNGGAGNDSILTSNGREYIQFVEGNDTIWNFDPNDTLHWINGSIDETLVGTADVTLVGESGTVTLKDVIGKRITVIDNNGDVHQHVYSQGLLLNNSTNNIILSGSIGNDTITNTGQNVSISAVGADDSIYNAGGYATIDGGDDNDTINNEGAYAIINGGSGNDSIFNAYADFVTINAGRGQNTIANFGSNASINGGELDDTIWNSGFKVISSGQLVNSGQNVTINGADGDDSIISYGPNMVINGGERADTLYNYGNYSTVNGDNGDDVIINRGMFATVNGGNGYDSVVNHGDYSTLYGGKGNDTLVGDNSIIETFRYSNGDDVILNYGRDDSIKLDTAYTSTAIVGKDFIIGTGNGSINVKNGANMAITVRNISNRTEILNEDNDELATLAADVSTVQSLPDGASYDPNRTTIYVNSAYIYQLDARDYLKTVTNIDASKMKTVVELTGNDNNNVIRASNGGSVIRTGAGSNTLYGGAGDDLFILSKTSFNNVIDNYSSGDVIQLQSGHVLDSSISGSDVVLQLTDGMLTVKRASKSDVRIIEADNSNDQSRSLANTRDYISVSGDIGDDYILNSGSFILINALGGDDYVVSSSTRGYVTINGGEGNDTVKSADKNSVIYGGIGDDLISISGSNQTVVGGTGNDTVVNYGSKIVYDYSNGDGNDLIFGYKAGDKIQLHNIAVSGNTVTGDDVILRLGNGFITLLGAAGKEITFISTRGETFTETYGHSVEGGDDTTFIIEEDTTPIPHFDDTTSTAPVDDTTSTAPVEDTTSTAPVEDTTSTTPVDDTTSTAPVDDTTSTAPVEDTTSMAPVEDTTSTAPVEDTTSTAPVEDTTSTAPVDDTTSTVKDDTTVDRQLTQQGVIKAFMHSLDQTSLKGVEALDQAIRACSNFSGIQDAIDTFLDQCRNADDPMTFLNQQCGIVLGNVDTGAITGSDAGNLIVKSAEDIVPENEDDTVYPSSTTFNIDGLTVTVPNKNTLTAVQKNIIKGLYNWWLKGAIELNEESYGLSFTEEDTTVKRMNVVFDNNNSNKTLAAINYSYNGNDGKTNSLTLKIPMAYYSSIAADDVNGITDDGHSYMDRTIAHEFTHALMAVNVGYFYQLPIFVSEGLAELTHGIDDTRGRQILNLADDPDQLAVYLDTSRRSGAETGDYSSGYMFFRWLAKQSATVENVPVVDDTTSTVDDDTTSTVNEDTTSTVNDDTTSAVNDDTTSAVSDDTTSAVNDDTTSTVVDDTTVDDITIEGVSYSGDRKALTIDADYKSKTFDASDYDSDVETIDASTVNKTLSINGNDNDNVIKAGRRGGSVNGGEGDDTLVGNIGIDQFVYDGGDDVILNYTTLKDKIRFNVDSDEYALNGNDVVFVTDEGLLTVKDAANKKIKIIDANGKTTNKIYDTPLPEGANYNSSHTMVKFEKTFEEDFDASDYNAKIRTLNAVKAENAVELIGNDNNNVIKLGTGGGIVDGAEGDDKMYGNTGRDTFIYSGGDDVIYKYTAGQDTIQIDYGDVESVKVSGSAVVFMFDDGSLTVKNAKGERLTIIDIEGVENVYAFSQDTDDFSSGIINSVEHNELKASDEESDMIFNADEVLADGLTISGSNNAVTVDDEYADEDLNVSGLSTGSTTIITVNASERSNALNIVGNAQNNVIRAGSGGGIVDGADGNDQIYAGEGADTVIYVAGQGRDTVFNYDFDYNDIISVSGVSTIGRSDVINFGNGRMFVDLGDSTLTFAEASSNQLNFMLNDQLTTVDVTDLIFSANRQSVILGAEYPDSDFDASGYSRLQTISSPNYENEIYIIGNSNNNLISIGAYGGTLDGGSGGNNRLFGNEGENVFVYTAGLGKKDTIYNYNSEDSDIVSLNGVDTLDNSNFLPVSGGMIFVNVGDDTLTFSNYSSEMTFVYGEGSTFDYNSTGLLFSANFRMVTFSSDYEGESFDASGYSQLQTLNASNVENSIELLGNNLDNDISIGAYGGTLDGGDGNDKLYGGADRDLFVHTIGAGRDTIYNFDGDNDEIQLFNWTEEITQSDFLNLGGGSVLLNLGNDTLTFVRASGEIKVNYGTEETPLEFEFNPNGMVFTANRQSVMLTDDYEGEDDAFDANVYPAVRTINASSRTNELNIIGNSNDNVIRAGSGGGSVEGGAGKDQITGGEGNDIFVYTVGSGSDTITNYGEGDVIHIYGVNGELTETSFVPTADGTVLIDLGNDTLTLVNAYNEINVNYGQTDLTEDITFDTSGATLSSDRRSISVDDSYPQNELNAASYGSALITIDAVKRNEQLDIYGNANDNNISMGTGGGLVDGGTGADKLYGGNGRDVFVYTVGSSGSDTVYKYNASNSDDAIEVIGIDELDKNAFKLGDNGVVLVDFGNSTLTLVDPQGVINVVDESENEIYSFDSAGSSLYGGRMLQIDSSYNDTLVDASNYGDELETITAVNYQGEGISIVGNDRNNVLRAGVYDNTLDGGSGRDSLYGDVRYSSADTFIVAVNSGDKHIFNYSSTLDGAEDAIVLIGDVGEITDDDFVESGTDATLTVGYNKIVVHSASGNIQFTDEDGNELYSYGMPDGVSVNGNRKYVSINDEYPEDSFDAKNYNTAIETIAARERTTELEIIGNANDNRLFAGPGGGTLDGGAGSDRLYGYSGADVFRYSPGQGNDTVFDFDSTDEDAPDVIMISGVESISPDAVRQASNGNVEISTRGGTLMLFEPKGAVTLVNDDGEPIFEFDTTGTTLSGDNRTLYVGYNYPETMLAAVNYSSLVATILAVDVEQELLLTGNANANVIKVGSGGGTVNGGGYNDHLYGGAGRDIFQYHSGEGNDYIYDFNATVEDSMDAIQVLDYRGTITKANFRDTANGNTVIQLGTNTITLVEPIGAISVYGADMETEEPFVYGKSLQAGVSYNYNKTRLTISEYAILEDEDAYTFIVSDYSNNLRHIDGTRYTDELIMLGDSKANEFYAGTGGSSMDGGAGVDKLYGGNGADTYVYKIGEGNDYILNYDSTNEDAMDVIQLIGDTSGITKSSFRDSGRNTILTMGNNQLTFIDARGRLLFVDEYGEEIIGYDSTLPNGVSYNDNKSRLTISRDAELEDNVFDMETLANSLRDIDGSAYEGDLHLIGNAKPNELRAGTEGATLDGGEGTDHLYGGSGADVFVLSVGGGNDQIFNYNGDQGDVLQLVGGTVLTRSNFLDSNNNTFINIGNQKVMLDNPVGAITVIDESGDEIIVYGSSMPSGVYYESNRTRLVIGANAELADDELEFSVESYGNNLRDIDASNYRDNGVTLIGDNHANVLKASGVGSYLDGSAGNDQMYGGAGADTFAVANGEGNEIIYNYDGADEDIVQVTGISELSRANFRDSGGNIILSMGSSNVTFVNARGPIILSDEEGNTLEATYDETLPSGLTYNGTKTKLTVGRVDQLEDNLLNMATLSNNIRDIDATRYEYGIVLVGNEKTNELRAGSGGSSLDGSYGIDKLYGGAGADTYVVSVGGGNDVINNYNGNEGDIIQVWGIDTITNANFSDSGSSVILNIGNERITINEPRGMITVVLGDDESDSIGYGGDLSEGVSYSADKTTLYINRGAYLESDTFDMETLANSLKNINAENYDGYLVLKGNDKANELRAGTEGSSMDGGLGNDKLYGNEGADTFVYTLGEGNDYIYNLNGADGDVIQVFGVDTIGDNNFRESGRNTLITLGNNRLTLVNAQGRISFVDENGDEIRTFNEDLAPGVYYNNNKTKLTVSRDADLGAENELDAATLASNLRDIDASEYEGEIILKGNSRANELKAGTNGSSLDGAEGNDKLYGGAGVDTFAYVLGEGNDYIYNYSGGEGDVIQVFGLSYLDETAFRDSGDNVIITMGSNRLTLSKPQGQIVVEDENGSTLATYNDTLPVGVSYTNNKQKLVIASNAELEDVTVAVADYFETLKDVDATAYPEEIALLGDTKANELQAGSGGSTLDGGLGNDKLYGGAGADMFRYVLGDGNDYIYNFNSLDESAADTVQLIGVGSVDQADFRDAGRNTILTVGNNRITFSNPQGQIKIVDENGEELALYGSTLPSGIYYNSSKSKLTIGRNADLEDNTFDAATLSSNLRNIDGSAYEGELILLGNDKANELRAGSGGSTLDGNEGSDKLYGGSGTDVFVHEDGDGNDRIYGYNGNDGDVLQVDGSVMIERNDFRDSGNNVVLTIGSDRVTFINPTGQISVVGSDGEVITTYGEAIPNGVYYNKNRTVLTVSAGAEVETIDMNDYNNALKDVNATAFEGEIEIIGNALSNEIKAGSGGSLLNGGLGTDNLYGGTGTDVFEYTLNEGNDRIHNYSYADSDVIVIQNLDELTKANFRESGKNTVITVGENRLTVVNAPTAIAVSVEGSEEVFTYGKELPDGVNYNSSKTKLTVTANANLDDNGNEFRVEEYSNNLRDINASKYDGELVLLGDDKSNDLRAGMGGGTLSGGGSNDKLYAGAGTDEIIYTSGNDVVYGFNPEQDSVTVQDATISTARINGNDIVYVVGDGTLTLKNVASYGLMSINLNNGSNEEEQLPTEDYWFMKDETESDPLNDVMNSELGSVDMPTDFNDVFKNTATELTMNENNKGARRINYAARHR